MKKLLLIISIWFLSTTAYAITFSSDKISIEKSSVKYIYTGKTWFSGYFVIIESSQPGKFAQLTADLAVWRTSHSLTKDGTPMAVDGTNIILDSGYVGGWLNNGKYDIVTSPMTNMSLLEQNNVIAVMGALLPECKIFRSGRSYVDYKCN